MVEEEGDWLPIYISIISQAAKIRNSFSLSFIHDFQHQILIFSFSSRVKIISPVFIFVIPYLSYLTAELFGLSSILAWVLFLFWANYDLEKFDGKICWKKLNLLKIEF